MIYKHETLDHSATTEYMSKILVMQSWGIKLIKLI